MYIDKISILIPCYNEAATIDRVVDRVLASDSCGLDKEVIIIDDASSDGSYDRVQALAQDEPRILFARHDVNRGKGAAIRTGIGMSTGGVLVVQDADLEYDPVEYPKMLTLILEDKADVVYGSRFRGGESARVLYFWHSLGQRQLIILQFFPPLLCIASESLSCALKILVAVPTGLHQGLPECWSGGSCSQFHDEHSG